MSLFSGPEHESYVQLCRELRLPREFEEGDWFLQPLFGGTDYPTVAGTAMAGVRAEDLHVWVPRLDQLIAMLEEVGVRRLEFELLPPDEDHASETWSCGGRGQVGIAPTREEAALRLWLAVTGRQVPA